MWKSPTWHLDRFPGCKANTLVNINAV